jgi:hypothetical protein
MPPDLSPCPVTPAVERANDRLRAFVRAHGGRPWTREDLAVLARLRREWLAAQAGLAEAA